MTSIDRVPLKDVSNSLAITPVISALDAGDSGASPSTSLILESESVNNGLLRKPTEELPTTETIVSKHVSHDPCGFWRISGDLDGVREIDPGEDPAWLVDGEDYLEVADILGGEADVFEISEPAADANLVDVPEPTSDAALEYLRKGFRQLEKEEVNIVAKGGHRKSAYLDNWARNRFNDWRIISGITSQDTIEDMFENSCALLNEQLSTFFLQVQRRDGKLYPGETLVGLLRAIGRIIRARCCQRSVETSKPEEEFYILEDSRFMKACVACTTSARHSGMAGVGRKRRVTAALTPEQDAAILAQAFMSKSDRRGCQLRLAFYVSVNFCVRAQQELYNLCDIDFEFSEDRFGRFVRFDERSSKNHKIDLKHCQPEKLRRPVTCYLPDVVLTFDTYFAHLPKWLPNEPGPHPLFLRPIDGILRDPGVVSSSIPCFWLFVLRSSSVVW